MPNKASGPRRTAPPVVAQELEVSAVRTRRVFEDVCAQVRRQIEQGVLQPGQRLPSDRELAEQFGTSRGGVREALRSLETAGLVEARSGVNGGFFIRASGSHGITQAVRDMVGLAQVAVHTLTEARIEITNVAIRMACRNATEAEFDAIEADIQHHAQLFREGRASRDSAEVARFYHLLAQATHNEVIVAIVDALSENLRVQLARLGPQPHHEMIPARRRVLKLLRARDAEQACAAMTTYFRKLDRYLEEGASQAAAR
jgi:DNA-binding FadR family transcriptional regulator